MGSTVSGHGEEELSLTPATKYVKGSFSNAQLYAVIVIYLMLD